MLITTTEVRTGDGNPKTSVRRSSSATTSRFGCNPPVHSADQRFLEEAGESRCADALHFTVYNFARVHQTLRVTPAMQAGLASHVWSIEEIVSLTDRAESATAA